MQFSSPMELVISDGRLVALAIQLTLILLLRYTTASIGE